MSSRPFAGPIWCQSLHAQISTHDLTFLFLTSRGLQTQQVLSQLVLLCHSTRHHMWWQATQTCLSQPGMVSYQVLSWVAPACCWIQPCCIIRYVTQVMHFGNLLPLKPQTMPKVSKSEANPISPNEVQGPLQVLLLIYQKSRPFTGIWCPSHCPILS